MNQWEFIWAQLSSLPVRRFGGSSGTLGMVGGVTAVCGVRRGMNARNVVSRLLFWFRVVFPQLALFGNT